MRTQYIVAAAIALTALGSMVGCEKKNTPTATTSSTDAEARCEHDLKTAQCPFCTPSLIESEGFCGEHGVAEALCATCRPYLKAAFRAKGDWCDEHKLPESQCITCNPELADKITGGHGEPHPEEDGHDH